MRLWRQLTRSRLDFDPVTLPWVDRPDAPAEIQRRHRSGELSATEADTLAAWHRDGAVILRGAVEPGLLDQLWADYERGWQERPACLFQAAGDPTLWKEATDRQKIIHHFRLMDFHNLSEAASHIMMHPAVIRFCRLVFGDSPVAMQSLTFEYGSEQDAHQDFAYVHSGILSHLIGAQVAGEDIDQENGPIFYYAGSHRLPKFDFGNGRIIYDYQDPHIVESFSHYLRAQAEAAGLTKQYFVAQRGDILVWHGAVVHGGSPVLNPGRSRKSFVSHYSSRRAYPRDRRSPLRTPPVTTLNEGLFYQWRHSDHVEWRYSL